MSMIEWAFEQDIPTGEKLVLVWIATRASSNGIAPQHRNALMHDTGYKTRSIQRLLRSLVESGHLEQHGDYFVIGPKDPIRILASASAEQLPNYLRPMTLREIADAEDGEQEACTKAYSDVQAKNHAEAISQVVADHVGDRLDNFETRMMQHIDRMAVFHVEPKPEPEPVDPVLENPLYQELIDNGMVDRRAYLLSQRDLEMTEELDNEAPLDVRDFGAVGDSDDEYPDDRAGRFARIADILHGAEAVKITRNVELLKAWKELEDEENKHTVNGEMDAFLLLYPAIIDAAKANVGTFSLSDFLNRTRIKEGDAPWHHEINPIDKDDPALMAEISIMLGELADTNDPRCEVQPRTKETGAHGEVHQETLLGYHRRVRAKHREMLKLKQMGVI